MFRKRRGDRAWQDGFNSRAIDFAPDCFAGRICSTRNGGVARCKRLRQTLNWLPVVDSIAALADRIAAASARGAGRTPRQRGAKCGRVVRSMSILLARNARIFQTRTPARSSITSYPRSLRLFFAPTAPRAFSRSSASESKVMQRRWLKTNPKPSNARFDGLGFAVSRHGWSSGSLYSALMVVSALVAPCGRK